ncbi:MAG: hypothetical protein QOJ51_5179 [Acidobacteriaceae bacterium]|nr:hypothetical protein [Acidobacteriaceae bacterium]
MMHCSDIGVGFIPYLRSNRATTAMTWFRSRMAQQASDKLLVCLASRGSDVLHFVFISGVVASISSLAASATSGPTAF